MKWLGTERLSWLDERRLRLEHDLLITRGKMYCVGWAMTGSRSKYRRGRVPWLPWRDRATMSGADVQEGKR
jgi:hypothetical protein